MEQSAQEYDRVENLRRRDKDQLEAQLKEQRMQFEAELIRNRGVFEEKIEEANRKHSVDNKNEKEKVRIE